MKRKDIFRFFNGLQNVSSMGGKEFSYAVVMNVKRLEPIIEAMDKLKINPSEAYKEFDQKRLDLARSYSKCAEDGTPIIINNNYQIDEQRSEEFLADFENLKKAYKDALDDFENQKAEYEASLEKDVEFSPYKISKADLPDSITPSQLYTIEAMVEF